MRQQSALGLSCMAPKWEEMAVVGRIARTFGVRGQLAIGVETDFPHERFHVGAELFIQRGGEVEPLTIASVCFHGERPIVGFQGIVDMTSAKEFTGAELRVPVERLARLPEGMFYRHDLVGCRVHTSAGKPVGTVVEVEGTMAGSRLVVESPRGEVLVPLAAAFCPTIDLVHKRIVINPLEGLLDLNERSGDVRSRAEA